MGVASDAMNVSSSPTPITVGELFAGHYQGVGLVLFYYSDRIRAVNLKEGFAHCFKQSA